jgi:hypothetical protein
VLTRIFFFSPLQHAFAGERPAVATAVASAVSPAPSGGASVFRAPSVTAGPSLLPVPVVGEEGKRGCLVSHIALFLHLALYL